MKARTIVRVLFLTALIPLGINQICFADAAEQLQQAENYKENGYFSQAEQAYRQIVSSYPASSSALEAQKQLVFVELKKQKKLPGSANPQAELDRLTADFAGNSGLPQALYDVAAEYQRLKDFQKAKRLYQSIVQQYVNSPQAAKAAVDVPKTDILALIKSGQADAAQQAIDGFIAQYSSSEYTAGALNDVAYFWRRFKRYDRATELYRYVADTWPSSPDAMWAQMGVAKSNVEAGNFNDAKSAADKLLSNYSTHPELATALHYLARRYRKEKRYDDAKGLYQEIINRFPNTTYASNAQIEIAKMDVLACINSGDFAAAKAATDKLASDFSGNLNLPRMLYEIPFEYERLGRYADAKDVCQKIISSCPGHFRAQKAAMDICRYDIFVLIDADEHNQVSTDVDKLIADYGAEPYLPELISQLATHYRRRASRFSGQGNSQQANNCLNNAAALYDRVITQFGSSLESPAACLSAGDCCRKSGQYEKSNQYYQKVVDDYSDYYLAWQAQFMIGRNYEKMGRTGSISQSAAKAGAKAAYEQLLARYPTCKAAVYVNQYLSR